MRLEVEDGFPGLETILVVKSVRERFNRRGGEVSDALFAALGFGVVARLLDEAPRDKKLGPVGHIDVELGLDGESIHDESIRCIKKSAAVADRKTRRVFNKTPEETFSCKNFSHSSPKGDSPEA